MIEQEPECFEDIDWKEISNNKSEEENKETFKSYMREKDAYGVKPFRELLELIKDGINSHIQDLFNKKQEDYFKSEKNIKKRKVSDFDMVFHSLMNKKRKLSGLSNNS